MNNKKITIGEFNSYNAIIKLKNTDEQKKIKLELTINNNNKLDKQITSKVKKQLEIEKALDEYHIEELHYIKYSLNKIVKNIND